MPTQALPTCENDKEYKYFIVQSRKKSGHAAFSLFYFTIYILYRYLPL